MEETPVWVLKSRGWGGGQLSTISPGGGAEVRSPHSCSAPAVGISHFTATRCLYFQAVTQLSCLKRKQPKTKGKKNKIEKTFIWSCFLLLLLSGLSNLILTESLFWVFVLCHLRDQWQSISLAHSKSLPHWSLVDALFIEKSPRTFPPGFIPPDPTHFFFNSPISLFILKFPTHREV